MKRPTSLKVGDMFKVIEEDDYFKLGEIITLLRDDGTDCPYFWNAGKTADRSTFFSKLEPYAKTVRCAQVGDIVIGNNTGFEYMVLERGQNTVLLSQANYFKKAYIGNYHFDELEKHYTLKNAPEVEDEKTAEAMKLLKEAGYKIVKE